MKSLNLYSGFRDLNFLNQFLKRLSIQSMQMKVTGVSMSEAACQKQPSSRRCTAMHVEYRADSMWRKKPRQCKIYLYSSTAEVNVSSQNKTSQFNYKDRRAGRAEVLSDLCVSCMCKCVCVCACNKWKNLSFPSSILWTPAAPKGLCVSPSQKHPAQ